MKTADRRAVRTPGEHKVRVPMIGLGRIGLTAIEEAVRQSGAELVGASICHADTPDKLRRNGGLYCVVTVGRGEPVAELRGPINSMYAGQDPWATVDLLADLNVDQILLSATREGFYLDPQGKLTQNDAVDADINVKLGTNGLPILHHGMPVDHDGKPRKPTTWYFYVVCAATLRRQADRPLVIYTIDNKYQGPMVKLGIEQFAERWDPALAAWIHRNMDCPRTAVDKIVPKDKDIDPGIKTAAIEALNAQFGLKLVDPLVFLAEVGEEVIFERPGRPGLDFKAPVLVVEDAKPYTLRKRRRVNGSHTLSAGIGELAGFATLPEAMDKPGMSEFIQRNLDEVAAIVLPAEEKGTLLPIPERFALELLGDKIARLAENLTAKWADYVLATAIAAWKEKSVVLDCHAFATASWLLLVGGKNQHGRPLDNADKYASALRPFEARVAAWLQSVDCDSAAGHAEGLRDLLTDIGEAVRTTEVEGDAADWKAFKDAAVIEPFMAEVARHLTLIADRGIEKALQEFAGSREESAA